MILFAKLFKSLVIEESLDSYFYQVYVDTLEAFSKSMRG